MASELKPCSFCGKTNISVGYDSGLAEVMRPAYFAVCRDCGARGPCRPTDDGAIAAWNNRVGVAETATTTGNAAKMREALMQVKELNDLWFDTFALPDGATSIHDEIEDIISAALAAPPRNCDRFKTKEEAALAYAEECNAFIPQSILWQIGEWLDWLFYEAKEGGAK